MLELRSINETIRTYTMKDYAGSTAEGEVLVDCSLGVNGDLLGDCIFQRLHQFEQKIVLQEGNYVTVINEGNYAEIKYYPHDETLKKELADWYHRNGVGEDWLRAENFILGNGSYDILCNMNLLCLTNGRKVLGHAPQFTAYIDHVACSGSGYAAYYLPKEQNYAFSAEGYLAEMRDEFDLFIIENPNNPTGQMLPLGTIRRIAQKALEMEKILIVDEAYGEYIPFGSSAINLVRDFPNIIVTRSFSKGWGMAGVRLGYGVASTESDLLEQLQKLVLPFNSNAVARTLAESALRTKLQNPEDPFGIWPVIRNKQRLLDKIEEFSVKYDRALKVAQTHFSTPILMLYYDGADPALHLAHHLLRHGILTVSCETYVGVGKEAVRIMLPESAQMPLLLELLEKAVAALPA
ncbi:MAG: aminotransferase class I/II-fold pyridoxal phosphate-dependent enzyme [Butyricicoccus sp.]|nr:aminotransferase class I/II-fold pyridoxal phosphate-dependent enzyme [Butyricicoccus sp.]